MGGTANTLLYMDFMILYMELWLFFDVKIRKLSLKHESQSFILFYIPQIFGNYLETRIWSHSGWKLYQLCSHSNEDECYLYQYICDLDVFGFYVYYSLYHLGLFQFENVARNAKSFWWELLGSTLLLGYSNLFLYIPNLFWF